MAAGRKGHGTMPGMLRGRGGGRTRLSLKPRVRMAWQRGPAVGTAAQQPGTAATRQMGSGCVHHHLTSSSPPQSPSSRGAWQRRACACRLPPTARSAAPRSRPVGRGRGSAGPVCSGSTVHWGGRSAGTRYQYITRVCLPPCAAAHLPPLVAGVLPRAVKLAPLLGFQVIHLEWLCVLQEAAGASREAA